MQILKRVGFWLAVMAFGIFVLLLAVTLTFNRVFQKPDTVKSAMAESGLYGILADEISEETITQVQAFSGATEKEQGIVTAVTSVITPDLVQQNIEIVIDSVFLWLGSTSASPQFTLDISAPKQQIAENLADQGVNRLQALPACTPQQIRTLRELNPITIPCKPPVSPDVLREQYEQQILASNAFTSSGNITENDFTTSQGESVFTEAQGLQRALQMAQMLVWLFLVAGITAVVLALTLRQSNAQLVRALLFSLMASGLLMLVFGYSTASLINKAVPAIGSANSQPTQAAIQSVIEDVGSEANQTLLLFGFGSMLTAGIGLIAARKLRGNPTVTVQAPPNTGPMHPIFAADGRVYFVPDSVPAVPPVAPSGQPPYPPDQSQNPQPYYAQQPAPLPPQSSQPYVAPPQVPQQPPQPWQPPQSGEKKWWE